MASYRIPLFTGNVDNAGTGSNVFISVFGNSSHIREYILDQSGNDRL